MDAAAGTRGWGRKAALVLGGLVALGPLAGEARPKNAVKPVLVAQVAAAKQVRATLTVRVRDVDAASRQLRIAASQASAEVVSERRTNTYFVALRLAPERVERFVEAAAALGETQVRELSADDVRASLDATARRRRQAAQRLERAERAALLMKDTAEAGMLDEQVFGLQSELEGLDAERVSLEDAAARAWVEVTLTDSTPPPPPAISDRDIAFYPGVRVASLVDLGATTNVALWGVGLSLQPNQWLSFEASFFRASGALAGRSGADAFLFTVGLDATSRLFGWGKRTFFNPHLGLRLGVGASFGRVDAVTGVSLGLEVVRLQRLVVDVQVRGLGQWLNRQGPHVGIESGVTVSTAW